MSKTMRQLDAELVRKAALQILAAVKSTGMPKEVFTAACLLNYRLMEDQYEFNMKMFFAIDGGVTVEVEKPDEKI